MAFAPEIDLAEPVPLFPLPNVVLFPRAVLPLHLFEDRYRVMMADALTGPRQIAMAFLRPGWESDYHGRPAIEPVVCVGRILQHERLEDGRYNLLLQGVARAEVIEEYRDRAYRYALLRPLQEHPVLEIDLADHRRRLQKLFNDGRVTLVDLAEHLVKLFDSTVTTPDLTDVLSFALLRDMPAKQSLLAEPDVLRRVERAVMLLQRAYPEIPRDAQGRAMGSVN